MKNTADKLHIRWYGRWETLLRNGLPKRWATLLSHWLSRQRWYLEKGDKLSKLTLEKTWPLIVTGKTVWWCILKVYSPDVTRVYQLPMVLLDDEGSGFCIATLTGSDTGYIVDAWTWPPFAERVLKVMAGEEQEDHLTAWNQGVLRTDLPAKPLLKEQSNTAVTLGETYFLKAIRSLAAGIQPEEEMGRELTARSFPHTIPMLSGVSLNTVPKPTNLAMISKFVPSQGSGWEWLLASLQELNALPILERWKHIPSNSASLLESARLLGQRTAELHRCLDQPSDDPAFAPEPFGKCDFKVLCARILDRYEILRNLTKQHRGSPLRELFTRKEVLLAMIQQPFMPTSLNRHRIHGDYHLGQVLRTENDWIIIDFEGEPLRPLNERRAKDLCLRDVAGMLRSFAYLSGVIKSPFPDELSKKFMEGYVKAEATIAHPSSKQLLLLYIMEKTLYEIEYELVTKRGPEWLVIPLSGAVSLLNTFNN